MELGRFQKRPTCMVCERRRVPRGSVEDFLKRMRDLVGDEYEAGERVYGYEESDPGQAPGMRNRYGDDSERSPPRQKM